MHVDGREEEEALPSERLESIAVLFETVALLLSNELISECSEVLKEQESPGDIWLD